MQDLVSDVDSAVDGSHEYDDNEEGMDIFVSEKTPEVACGSLDTAQQDLSKVLTACAESSQVDRNNVTKPQVSSADCALAPAASGSQGSGLAIGSKGKIRVYGKERKVDRSSKQKHRPVGPKGTIFLAEANTHLDRSRVVLGNPEPQKLKIVLCDTKKNIHYRHYIDMEVEKWNDPKWIADINKWRYQVFLRAFKRDPAETRPTRAKWTWVERSYLEWLILKKVKKTGARLEAADWRRIQEKHNGRWAGKKVYVGERLHLGGVARTEQTIGERSLVALKGMVDRNEEFKKTIDEIVGDGMEKVADADMQWLGLEGGEKSATLVGDDEEQQQQEEEEAVDDGELFGGGDRDDFGLEEEEEYDLEEEDEDIGG